MHAKMPIETEGTPNSDQVGVVHEDASLGVHREGILKLIHRYLPKPSMVVLHL